MYEEDKKAMEILQRSLDAQRAKEAGIAGQTQSQPQTVYVQQNYYVQNPPTPNGALPNGNPQAPSSPLLPTALFRANGATSPFH